MTLVERLINSVCRNDVEIFQKEAQIYKKRKSINNDSAFKSASYLK